MSVTHVRNTSSVTARRDGAVSTATVHLINSSTGSIRGADYLVCKNDDACAGFQTRFPGNEGNGGAAANETSDMVCYKGGLAIERNWQMCDVTSEHSSSSNIRYLIC